jgi:UDP-N-acetylmuramate dehydrogenase
MFADGMVEALVVRIVPSETKIEENAIYADAGKNLAQLVNECAEQNLDLSVLTGIPGTVGGALFGNAGQGFGGTWIDHFIEEVEAYVDGEWKIFGRDDLEFGYRSSSFKEMHSPIIWSVKLNVPSKPSEEVQAEIEALLKKRIETQPHRKTAGSCFVSLPDGTPAWKLIDEAGLRGEKVGDIQISEKHANFLNNTTKEIARFEDAVALIRKVKEEVDLRNDVDLRVEMRCYDEEGKLVF